jgi:DNA-binding CsgD family transcriptional regulator
MDTALEHLARGIAAAVLDQIDVPCLLLEARGRILVANAPAKALLAEGTFIGGAVDRRLHLVGPDADGALARFLADLPKVERLDIPLGASSNGGGLSISLRPANASASPGNLPLVVAVIGSGGHDRLAAARSRFNLSEAETQVVGAIASGQSVSEFAQRRGVSVNTARNQLRSAMLKAGVSRQVQLAPLLDQLGDPFDRPN